jgi:hypothetical protein
LTSLQKFNTFTDSDPVCWAVNLIRTFTKQTKM